MRITIASVGSRGDVQPFLALAVALARKGHAVRLATCDPFRALVEGYGIEFASLGGDIKQIVGDEGRAELIAAESNPLRAMRALRRHLGPLIRQGLDALPAALEGSDAVVAQILVPGASHWAERHGVPCFDAAYDPIFPTRAFAHCGAPAGVPRGLPSWFTYIAAEQVFWQAFRADVDSFRRRVLGLGGARWLGPSCSARRRPPTLLGFSGAIVPRPPDWPEHVTVTGPWFLDAPGGWTPDAALAAFLAAGPPPVYVGFGSMTVERPEEITRVVVDAVRRSGQRAILSTGWGGLARAGGDDVLSVGDVPHSWLFPRASAIVHHGGASTTAEALRAGVPQVVVPFLSDQPFWGRRVAQAGVGSAPIPIGKLDIERLYEGLTAVRSEEMRARAAEIGARVREERSADAAAAAIESRLAWSAAARGTGSMPTSASGRRTG